MKNREMLKEAIADAKAVKEMAIANAKAALEEAFNPQLRSMLADKLMEMEDMDEGAETEVEEGYGKEEVEELSNPVMRRGLKGDDEPERETEYMRSMEEGDKEGMDEEMDLDEKEDLKEDERTDAEEEGYEDGMEDEKEDEEDKDEDEEIDLEDMSEDDLKSFIEDVIADMVSAGELEAGEEVEDDNEEVDVDVEIEDDEEVMAENARTDAEEEGYKDGMKDEKEDMEMKEMKDQVESLKKELNEINLLNSKLLYVNKLFRSKNLTESQKSKVLSAFDKAQTVKEAKLVFETISENLATAKKSVVKENLGRASKPAGVARKQPIMEVDSQVSRWQKLAGIK